MPVPASCEVIKDCRNCPKATDNTIVYASHPRGFHCPAQKSEQNVLIFLLEGEILLNSKEYAGTLVRAGEFILQAMGSKYEILAMTDVECVCYRFNQPEFFCSEYYNYLGAKVAPPLIYYPLKINPGLHCFLEASKMYLSEEKICRELLQFKMKELAYVLRNYYTDYELSMLVHSLSKYSSSFEYFVYQNHHKVKTVEEFAQLGGYTVTTFRRIFNSVFSKPVYEWMQEQRRASVIYELRHTNASISEICYKYGFESLPHFSNFCKKNFGASPRQLRKSTHDTDKNLPVKG